MENLKQIKIDKIANRIKQILREYNYNWRIAKGELKIFCQQEKIKYSKNLEREVIKKIFTDKDFMREYKSYILTKNYIKTTAQIVEL